MYPIARYTLLIGVVVVMLTGCKSTEKSAAPTVDYSQYKTYNITNTTVTNSSNPLFNKPQLSVRIQKELQFHLPSKGLDQGTKNERPDLYLYIYVVPETRSFKPVMRYDIGWRAAPFLAKGEKFSEYKKNTLVLDFVDSSLNELVWRGSVTIPFDNEEELYKNLSERLKGLVDRYPYPPTDS